MFLFLSTFTGYTDCPVTMQNQAVFSEFLLRAIQPGLCVWVGGGGGNGQMWVCGGVGACGGVWVGWWGALASVGLPQCSVAGAFLQDVLSVLTSVVCSVF